MIFRRKLHFIGLAVCLALLAGGCARKPAAPPEVPKGLPVEIAEAQLREMIREVLLTGAIKALEEASITALYAGRVVAVKVSEGDRVKAGQVLIALDTVAAAARLQQAQAALSAAQQRLAILRAGARSQERAVARNSIASAKSSLEKAELDLRRAEDLFKEGAVAREQVDTARNYYQITKAQYESALEQSSLLEVGARPEEIRAAEADVQMAQGALTEAKDALAKSVIRSPISGVVFAKAVNVGDIASPGGDPLMLVSTLDKVHFEAVVPEKDFAELAVGQSVAVTVDALPGRTFAGKLERLVPVAAEGSHDFLARIAIANPNLQLNPGMFARGNVLLERHLGAIVVSKDALLQSDTTNPKNSLFVVFNDKAQLREVTTGLEQDSLIEILSGVTAGEEVIVAGQQGLKSGEDVSIVRKRNLEQAK
jgi:RND family efflux transporter MFP subunit